MKLNAEFLPRTPWAREGPPKEVHPSPEEVPFIRRKPDVEAVMRVAEEALSQVEPKNLIVAGHGGSITTFKGIHSSLVVYRDSPQVFFVDTVDRRWLNLVRKRAEKRESLLVIVSKSGRTQTLLEAVQSLRGYPTVVVTQPTKSPLREMAEREGWPLLDHPPDVDGRFSGGFEPALLPALLSGIDLQKYLEGIGEGYGEWFGPEKELYELSWRFYLWEKAGREILYVPIYSKGLSGFSHLITQLIHESTGKEGRGMTVLVAEGPECQHHTNQRVLGGRGNIYAVFTIPGEDGPLRWEAEGAMESFREAGIPYLIQEYEEIDEKTVGRYEAFWHLFTLYSALLRGLPPFGQPEVERAKEHSRRIRQRKGAKSS